jgi:hypothetical protein
VTRRRRVEARAGESRVVFRDERRQLGHVFGAHKRPLFLCVKSRPGYIWYRPRCIDMRPTKKQFAGIVAATTVGAAVLYRLRSSADEEPSAEPDAEGAA